MVVVRYWAELQSVNGFRCYDNIARTRNVSERLYSLYAWFLFVVLYVNFLSWFRTVFIGTKCVVDYEQNLTDR